MRVYYSKAAAFVVGCVSFLSLSNPSLAQSQVHRAVEAEEKGYKITLALGHAHIHEGIEDGNEKWLMMPSWAFNADYVINKHWAFGLHNDLILENFTVEEHLNNERHTVLERSRPFATKVVGTYKPGSHLGLMLGVGDEITKEENLFLSTVGVDYGVHIHGGWEVVGELTYDVKWKSYDTWVLGFGISKFIGGRHHKHKG
ncbi:hypothetical protein B0I27_106150 [Arcticibacter pallidicorallinus]|uniref:Outer membrane protein with beta-barrel domain n=1 Tax=Arcticibacter pallidicorallinus TaxID=1259464 RepID=A0A2T0U3A0_9SPHI|nr:hypothetical protein [Arcticibacter pallidicorallinus]PRY52389.1 hypothetical protein B0I27_106150 [Arcticibacter pallidicorallinus]